ncbi:HIT family protein [Anaerocolumna cellulosilytica]|uniref:HIT family protein n=1 Tax=Anaerocolumna cellulosilytica TaxID=433286 RepID=A0A6S6R3L8_9FIRM|nr:HIT family protein [Anaerocolumna cellulosilytica]MBB5195981.1 diadenosine tetraphosphate (Ap4A) HIT family hydrolase [Anaerocolumna cellulosilytica]BCJ93721.1 HIT family protein [Anaerocolumna cellulosilytica]
MEKDLNCAYCMEGELVAKFGIKICDLTTSKLYLFKEQSHKGRVIVAHNYHVGDMTQLTDEERTAFFADIAKVSGALQTAFNPDKVNYGAYGDTGHHLHFHLVPKYKEEFEWGGVFAMNPDKVYLSEEEYKDIIDQIQKHL